MDILIRTGCILLLVILIFSQIVLASPMSERLYSDNLNGLPIKSWQTTVQSGTVLLDALGRYTPNSSSVMVNGEHVKTIDRFPVSLSLMEGDVVEIFSEADAPPYYVYLAEISSPITTDLTTSTLEISAGMNRLFRVTVH